MKVLSILIGVLLASLTTFGQESVTVMSYNLLNFPTGNLAGREDTLKLIINYVQPDLFLVQELKTDSGLQLIVNESFSDLPANYQATTFLPQQSNPGSVSKLQQAMVYNSDRFGLVEEGFIMTSTRDINRFKLYWKGPELENGSDTVFIYVFVTHLKSSEGTSNQQARLEMAQSFTTYLSHLPVNASVIFAGDLNLYNSTEPAYEELLDATNTVVMRDPIDSPGNWHSASFQPKSILTQSTRSSIIFGDGASSGIDDRFDFILLSDNMFHEWNTVKYLTDTYKALGNNGSCYNQSITACTGGDVPDSILRPMYFMSDHLPVVLELNIEPERVGVQQVQSLDRVIRLDGLGNLHVTWNRTEKARICLFDIAGRRLAEQTILLTRGENRLPQFLAGTKSGYYILNILSPTSSVSETVFLTD